MTSRSAASVRSGDGRVVALGLGGRGGRSPADVLIRTAFAFELESQLSLADELSLTDLAYTVMLIERGIVPGAAGGRLLRALAELHERPPDFVPDPAFGDLYTNREHWLLEREPAAGWLGAGRARREATTTAYHLVLRDRLLGLADALIGAGRVLVDRAADERATLMPDLTYLQVAQPTTFGHFLLGFAYPILRDLERIESLSRRVDKCPAGIGSGNGSLLDMDRDRLADLLGFERLVTHGRDAIWQADGSIETMAVVVAALVNLDRLAEDLMIFASAGFGFIEVAEAHTRGSRVLPQKRNPFALTHVRAMANRAIGTQATIAAAGRMPTGQPDSRSAVSGEVPAAIDEATGAARLVAEVVADLRVDADRCRTALDEGNAAATDLASVLVRAAGMDFRTAHGIVAALIRGSRSNGRRLVDSTVEEIEAAAEVELGKRIVLSDDAVLAALDPRRAVGARTVSGGAAPEAMSVMLEECRASLARTDDWRTRTKARLDGAESALLARAHDLMEAA